MDKLDKTRLEIQGRSDGDGMEYTNYVENASSKNATSNKYNSLESSYSKNFAPLLSKRKEPKFVPYEPYKAAVSPIIPSTKKYETVSTHVVIDSQRVSSLASSIIQINSKKELNSCEEGRIDALKVNDCSHKGMRGYEYTEKVKELEARILLLEKEKKDLESQFKIQTEVNADLKKMLIASLGEDMELKVHHMTEDKARLGMNVLQFTDELIQKNEDIEKLSAQCDVWKSKFEASSVMVDELARWKVTLSQKMNEAATALDTVLNEHKFIFEQLCMTYNILRNTQAAFNPNTQVVTKWDHNPKNLIQLTKEIQGLSTSIQERLLGRSCPRTNFLYANKTFTQFTPAEHTALQVLEDYDNLPLVMNGDSSGYSHHEPGKTACKILPHVCSSGTTVNCCKHCSGEIKLL